MKMEKKIYIYCVGDRNISTSDSNLALHFQEYVFALKQNLSKIKIFRDSSWATINTIVVPIT